MGAHGFPFSEYVCHSLKNTLFSSLNVFIFQALDGFIAVITQDGQLFYVSENVRDFLGYSQVSENFHR